MKLAYELSIIAVGVALAVFVGWQSAVPWFLAYALGFHRGRWA
jgi:hypothetical protein